MEVHLNCLPKRLPPQPDEYTVPFPPQYFSLPTTMSLVGPRGRGKTYAATLFNSYMFTNGYFTRMYCISPTYESNTCFRNLPLRPGDVYTQMDKGVEALSDVVQKVIEDVRWYEEITLHYTQIYEKAIRPEGWFGLSEEEQTHLIAMQTKIEQFYADMIQIAETVQVGYPSLLATLAHMEFPEPLGVFLSFMEDTELQEGLQDHEFELKLYLFQPPHLTRPAPVLFIDDMSHSPLYSPSPANPLVNLVLRHRHLGGQGYGLTIQFGVQTFKAGITRALRANTMQFLIFRTNDSKCLDDIYEEVGAFTTKAGFEEMYKRAVKDRHDFLLVDVNTADDKRAFRRGFDTILLPTSTSEKVNLLL